MAKKSSKTKPGQRPALTEEKIAELKRLRAAGMSCLDIARRLDINRGSVYYYLTPNKIKNRSDKKLKETKRSILPCTDSLAIEGQKVIKKQLNMVGQLQKINDCANDLLEKYSIQLAKLDPETGEPYQMSPTTISAACRVMAEIKSQLELQLKMFTTLYDVKAIEEFQEEVLAVIGSIEPEARNAILRRLHARRAVRQAFVLS